MAIQAFLVKLYVVPSASMQPTLQSANAPWQDRILVNRLAYLGDGPANGQIVVFRKPASWMTRQPEANPFTTALRTVSDFVGIGPGMANTLVKRVVAGPGDKVSCCGANGNILVNGDPSTLAYLPAGQNCADPAAPTRCFEDFKVPKDHYLVLGDNRANSSDSLAPCMVAGSDLGHCARFVPRQNLVGRAFAIVFPFNRIGFLE